MSDPQDQTVDFSQTPGSDPTQGRGPHRDSNALPESIGRYRVIRVLGQGGFGLVYLAQDEQLDRLVAVKVPHARLVSTPEEATAYLDEARTVAQLDHPQIVPVYDVGSSQAFPCFVVSKFIDGMDLETRIRQSRPGAYESAALVASVALALDYAHKRGLVHRDIKPGNILLDRSGTPFVGDFGLALREQDIGKGPRYAGTPAYMSPEQASGEGHRVDCRSDVFSLGVMLYQLLANRLPFRAPNQEQLLDLITTQDPVPLRQLDETIEGELERICLRAMAKRAADRYLTAREMAEDLHAFLGAHQTIVAPIPGEALSGLPRRSTAPSPTPRVQSDRRPTSELRDLDSPNAALVKIVPKGLRSFDLHDAGFFLDLLPGPRDRTGLPESVRFWKKRIENLGNDPAFSVGLLYGPSGCGKSSLVKAGLLPRLADSVAPVFIEATPQGTEARLLKELKRKFPVLEPQNDLKEAMASLRKGLPIANHQKVLVVIDQFEQWLHSRGSESVTELVQALRQCDGVHLQALILVRDDFWLATSRFLRELEVQLVEGHNCALVDLFPLRHAEKVLAMFGRAHGGLDPNATEPTRDQKRFLELAVAGLAQQSSVIPVRIALFAEMFKGKEWSVANLKSMGGAEGVGVAFLEETFSADSAPVEHRLLQEPIRALLRALLPEAGGNLRGHMKSAKELMIATGRPTDFAGFGQLVAILDQKLRLITPADPDGKPDREASQGSGNRSTTVVTEIKKPGTEVSQDRYFQLTHDYLVPSLRVWLTRKQKETWQGRVELMFADRAAIWQERPENRQLPSLWQWMQIRWFIPARNWNAQEARLMHRAGRFHGFRATVVALLGVGLGLLGWELQGRWEARRLTDRLLESSAGDLPAILDEMGSYKRWVGPLLRNAHWESEEGGAKRLRASLGLWATEGTESSFLFEQLLQAAPAEFVAIRTALRPQANELVAKLWTLLESEEAPADQRFRAACALAQYDPDDGRWTQWTDEVASMLVTQKPFVIAAWADALVGIKRKLMDPLAKMLVEENRGLPERGLIATVYGRLARDDAKDTERLRQGWAVPAPPENTSEEALTVHFKRKASFGLALLTIGQGREVWEALGATEDPTLRGYLIQRMAPWGIEADRLLQEWRIQTDPTIRRSLLICLGGYTVEQFSERQKRQWIPTLAERFLKDPDPADHAAAEWLLRRWGQRDLIGKLESDLAKGKPEGDHRWYLNGQGQTMIFVPPQKVDGWDDGGVGRSTKEIRRPFALASKEVTREQYARFRGVSPEKASQSALRDLPIGDVTWYDAAAYCNWLSEKEGIPKDQWCFLPGRDGKYDETLRLAPDYWKRTGYRLPTELEWEIACHGGTVTRFSFGESIELFEKNGWFDRNSYGKTHEVGSFASNDFGFFDLHGNVNEWCMEKYHKEGILNEDEESGREKDLAAELKFSRVIRGGSYNDRWDFAQTGERNWVVPVGRTPSLGFRVARTVRP